jgi:glycosyltransferase involved in cell wall biosynthesis
MKIAWFTPFSKASAIGGCSQLIVNELLRVAEVDVWHPRTSDARSTNAPRVVIDQAGDVRQERLQRYDLLVYNFGNHLGNHREIFEVSQRFRGIAVLHDFVLQHFFVEHWLGDMQRSESYVTAMERWYGGEGKRIAQAALARKGPPVWETDAAADYPLFEEAIAGMYGVIVHSAFLRQKVRSAYHGPVAAISLPRDVQGLGFSHTRADLGIAESDFLLVTVGHVNQNKRVNTVLEALGKNRELFRNVRYVVVGPYEEVYCKRLRALVDSHGLGGRVRFTGYQSDSVLHSYVHLADACINLRYPTFEGASASVIDEMLHGKPVVVTDTGFYSELPDDSVVKIDPAHEYEELVEALRRLVSEPLLRENLRVNAIRHAEKHFRASRYVQDMMPFLYEVRSQIPLLQLADRLSGELARMDVDAEMDIVGRVSREVSSLFSGEGCEGGEG